MTEVPMPRVLAMAALLLLAAVSAASGERLVLAWPPTFYDSAELIVHRGPQSAAGLAWVNVSARGFSAREELPENGALRIALPAQARCSLGLDPCAIVLESDLFDLRVVLQSPDTRGVPDTLARTAHDTVRAPSLGETGSRFVVLAAPNSPDFPSALSFASIVPVEGAAVVQASGSCLGEVEQRIEAGEVLTLSCAGAGQDLSGALLLADARVAVFSGNRSAPLPIEAGSGSSADLLLDLSPALEPLDEGTTWLAPPLPRRASHEGLGDLLRCAAGEALSVRIRDDRGRDEWRALAAGELLELDSADSGGDLVLRLDADGALACWQLSKSRSHRGTGDPAAVPLVPRELFTMADVAFAPDGYGEGTHLIVVAEEGATLSLDGSPLAGFVQAPGEGLVWTVLELAVPQAGQGRLLRLSGDAAFGAWLFGQGGYKAHGLAVARAVPSPAALSVLRGTRPDELEVVDETRLERWCDPQPGALVFHALGSERLLFVEREGSSTCLTWSSP